MPVPFRNRTDAGRQLAARLSRYANRKDVIVLGLPRGGVPVAFEVARALNAPLDVFLVRKLGVPGHEELAMGAIAMGGVMVLNEDTVNYLAIPRSAIDAAAGRERLELERRDREYRAGRSLPEVAGRVSILVDDGLATGSTMRAAVASLRLLDPARIVVAVPAAAPESCAGIGRLVDDIECVETPAPFYAVGAWYEDFSPTTDAEIRDLLERATHAHAR